MHPLRGRTSAIHEGAIPETSDTDLPRTEQLPKAMLVPVIDLASKILDTSRTKEFEEPESKANCTFDSHTELIMF